MEQWHTIICRFRAIWLGEPPRIFGAAGVVVILALLVLISGQVAQACPAGIEHVAHSTHSTSVSVLHKLRPGVSITSTMEPVGLITVDSADTRHGSGGSGHSCPCGCQTGCCSAGSAAIDVTISSLNFPEYSDFRLCTGVSSLAPHEPAPQFRPPRILI
jgi:hypothetical protein